MSLHSDVCTVSDNYSEEDFPVVKWIHIGVLFSFSFSKHTSLLTFFRSFSALYCIAVSITNLVAADTDGSNLEQSLKESAHLISNTSYFP